MLRRLLVAAPLAAVATTILYLLMRLLTDASVGPPAEDAEWPVVELGRKIKDSELYAGPAPLGCKLPGVPGDGCPTPIHRPEPVYPACGEGAGSVILDFVVGTDGRVSEVKIVSATSRCFAGAARRAAGSWIFRPMTVGGRPIRSRTQIRLVFEPQ